MQVCLFRTVWKDYSNDSYSWLDINFVNCKHQTLICCILKRNFWKKQKLKNVYVMPTSISSFKVRWWNFFFFFSTGCGSLVPLSIVYSTPVTLEPNLRKVRSSVEEMKKDLQRWEESGRFKTEERQWWETYLINQHDEGKRWLSGSPCTINTAKIQKSSKYRAPVGQKHWQRHLQTYAAFSENKFDKHYWKEKPTS